MKSTIVGAGKRFLRRLDIKLARDRPMRDPVRLLKLKAQERGVATILDIGANTGQFGAEFLKAGWRGTLVSFEPLSSAHAALTARAKAHAGSWHIPPAVAIGAADGEADINVAANSVSSSLLSVEERSTRVIGDTRMDASERVQVRALDHVVEQAWRGPFGLKIDTQGFELEVLRGASATLARTQVAMLEMSLVPLYRGGASFADLYAFMEAAGFHCIALTEGFADYARDEMLQVDGVFVRNEP